MTAQPPPPPRTKSNAWKVVLLVIGIPVGLVAALLGCGMLYEWTAKDQPIGDGDWEVVLSAAYVGQWMSEDFTVDTSAESFAKRRYIDGAYELEYEYDHPDADEPLYIYCTVSVEKTAGDAKAVYIGLTAGESLAYALYDLSLEEREDLFSWGSKSSCSLLVEEDSGAPVGNVFSCLKGTKAFILTLSGIYFDEAEALAELLTPVLEQVDRYDPAKAGG